MLTHVMRSTNATAPRSTMSGRRTSPTSASWTGSIITSVQPRASGSRSAVRRESDASSSCAVLYRRSRRQSSDHIEEAAPALPPDRVRAHVGQRHPEVDAIGRVT